MKHYAKLHKIFHQMIRISCPSLPCFLMIAHVKSMRDLKTQRALVQREEERQTVSQISSDSWAFWTWTCFHQKVIGAGSAVGGVSERRR